MVKKIAVVTGSRAEYGLLYWLMWEIKNDPDLQLQVIVTGMHLAPEFGSTYRQIEADGFEITARVESQLSSDSAIGAAKSLGLGTIGFADVYANLQPHLIVLLGDRYEILAAAQAALFAKIPVAHISGGEVTEGAFDESIRHSITKMSYLHFVAADLYRQRVIQLGEHPNRVFNVGDVGVDYIFRTRLLEKQQLEKELDFQFGDLTFMVTYHPVTLSLDSAEERIHELLNALDHFSSAKIIFTKSNADPGGRVINAVIDEYVQRNHSRCSVYASLGSLKYLSCLNNVDVVIGNSSSGIVEVPYFKKPAVNIGNRQKGRLLADSIIHCDEGVENIIKAIQTAIECAPQIRSRPVNSPYGNGNASLEIKNIIKQLDNTTHLVKPFYDLSKLMEVAL